jgi:hypothetical protein
LGLALISGAQGVWLGVGAFRLPGIERVAVKAILTIFLLLLLTAFFLFFTFLAAIAHRKKSSPE